jgi:dipeptide/tripeptide permease
MSKTAKPTRGFLFYTILERFSFYIFLAIFLIYFQNQLNFTAEKTGYYYSSFYYGISLLSVLIGFIADRKGYLPFFHLGIISLILGFSILIHISYSSAPINPIFPLILIILGVSINRSIVPVLIGNSSQIENDKGYTKFIWYLLFVNIGSAIAKPFTKAIHEANQKAIYEVNENVVSALFICGIAMLIAYAIWLLSNIKRSKFREVIPYSSETRNANNSLVVKLFVVTLPIFYILNVSSQYPTIAITQDNWTHLIEIAMFLTFGFVLLIVKQLNSNQLVKLIKVAILIILGVILISIVNEALLKIEGSTILIWFMYIALKVSSTMISPLMFYLIFSSSPIRYKGTFIGLYLGIIALGNATMFYPIHTIGNNATMLLILLILSVFVYFYLKTDNRITLPNKG